MGWVQVTDRKKLKRAGDTIGADLRALWEFQSDVLGPQVHTRAFLAMDGRTGYLYTDGYVDWDSRKNGPWALPWQDGTL